MQTSLLSEIPDLELLLANMQPDERILYEQLKQEAEIGYYKSEYDRCAQDCVYFIDTYCSTYDARLAVKTVPFKLYPQQIRLIRFFEECESKQRGGLIEKSRDSGASYLCCAYALWKWLFVPEDATGFGSRNLYLVDTLGVPDSLFEKIRMLLRSLPPWFIPKGFEWRKHSSLAKLLNPANGSTIAGEGGDDIGRGGRKSRFFVDEAAYLDHPKLADASLAANTNVRFDISTPRGLEEFYQKKQSGSVAVFRMWWVDDPRKDRWVATDTDGKEIETGRGRHKNAGIPTAFTRPKADSDGVIVTYPWYENERLRPEYRDPSILAQEVDIDYIGSGNPRYDRAWLIEQREKVYVNGEYARGWEPLRIETSASSGWCGTVTTYREPQEDHTYIVLADTARGLTENGTSDYSVAHVYDLETCEQVSHYRGKPVETEFAIDLVTLCTMYNRALLVVETPGPGEAVLSSINSQKSPYPFLYSYWDDDAALGNRALRYGLPMSTATKPESEAKLSGMLYDAAQEIRGSIVIRNPNTYEELIHYVKLRLGVCGAEAGGHDDEVTCCRLLAMVWAQYTTRGRRQGKVSQKGIMPKTANASSRNTFSRTQCDGQVGVNRFGAGAYNTRFGRR